MSSSDFRFALSPCANTQVAPPGPSRLGWRRPLRWQLALAVGLGAAACFPSAPTIIVGPDVRVSQHQDVPHVETSISANPLDPRQLVASVVAFTGDADGGANDRAVAKAFYSHDGGRSWAGVRPTGSGGFYNARAAFGPDGTAYFNAIGTGLHLSRDGGATWAEPIHVHGGDYPTLIVDRHSPHAGRIHRTTTVKRAVVKYSRSDDGGRTFTTPAIDAAVTDHVLLNMNTSLFSDGSIVITYLNMTTDGSPWSLNFVTSDDGVTFSAPKVIAEVDYGFHQRPAPGEIVSRSGFSAGAATSIVDPRTDRMYAVWADKRHGPNRVQFSYSWDRGSTWSEPLLVASDVPAHAHSYQAAISVNNEGVVGIVWFDTRHSEQNELFDVYFTASTDGGRSFLPARRVSRVSSRPQPWEGGGYDHVRHLSGGDYINMTADAEGVFHPLWPDARSGIFQAYTARIQVPTVLSITRHPEDLTATPGGSATFRVAARGEGRLTYAWHRNGVPLPGSDGARYTTPPLGNEDSGSVYTAVVRAGTRVVYSLPARLTVSRPDNEPPRVVRAAAAEAGPRTVRLTVEAEDDGDASQLTYTWSTEPGSAGFVTFHPNGTAQASATTATFWRAGTYEFAVRVSDADGLSTTSTTRVRVASVPTRIALSPTSAPLLPKAMQQFEADVIDQFGLPPTPEPRLTWRTTGGGSLDESGLFTADESAGGPFTVTASLDDVRATATVNIVDPDFWAAATNTTTDANTVRKVAGRPDEWDATAVSRRALRAGDGYVEFSFPQAGSGAAGGLTSRERVADKADLDFAIAVDERGWAYPLEGGEVPPNFVFMEFKPTDIFAIRVRDGVVTYLKNDQRFYQSYKRPSYPLRLGAALRDADAGLDNANIVVFDAANRPR
jgi:hypothetical protein